MKKLYLFVFAIFCIATSHAQVSIGTTNYETFAQAIEAINSGSKTGAITVNITGNTTEQFAVTLNKSGTGNANYTSVLIQPSGGAARTINLASNVFTLSGTSNVTINGLNSGGNSLTFTSAIPAFYTIVLSKGASNNLITNATLLGNGNAVVWILSEMALPESTNNVVSNCNISKSTTTPSFGIWVDTDDSSVSNTVITNNNIYDYGSATGESAGVKVGHNTKNTTVTNNRLYQTAARTYGQNSGINIAYNGGTTNTVTGNRIGFANAQGTGTYVLNDGTFTGIYVQTGNATTNTIQNNLVSNVSVLGHTSTLTSSAAFMGIYASTGLFDISNNTVGNTTVAGALSFVSNSTSAKSAYGIRAVDVRTSAIAQNTIAGISISGSSQTNAVSFTGIDISMPTSVWPAPCTSNTIGSALANSISNTTQGESAIVIGIKSAALGEISSNTIRDMSGFGSYGAYTNGWSSVTGIVALKGYSVSGNVSRNTIYNLKSNVTNAVGSACGMYIQTMSSGNCTALANNIYNLTVDSNNTASAINGIKISGYADIINNTIAVGNGMFKGMSIYGISVANIAYNNDHVYNNSVFIGGMQNMGNGNSVCFYLTGTAARTQLFNNIWLNDRYNSSNSSSTGTHASVILNVAGPQYNMPQSNANVFYGGGPGYILGIVSSVQRNTLADFITPLYSQSDNGFFFDPHFIAPAAATPNLHIDPTVQTIVEGHGVNTSLGDDIDTEVRALLTPHDIGSDAGNFTPMQMPSVSGFSDSTLCGLKTITITGENLLNVSDVKVGNTSLPFTHYGYGQLFVTPPNANLSGALKLESPLGTITTSMQNVYASPVISSQPQSLMTCPAVVSFSVTASNATAYQWRRNGIPLTNNATYSNVTTAMLTVNANGSDVSGSFDVVISGASGNCPVTSNVASLSVGNSGIEIVASGSTSICPDGSVTLTPMVQKPALSFDGIDDYVAFPASDYANFTLSVWVRTTQTGPIGADWYNGNGIVDGSDANLAQNQQYGTSLVGDKFAFGFRLANVNYTVLSNTSINTGQWTHITAIRDGASGQMRIYINGNLDATRSSVTGNFSLYATAMRIGSLRQGGGFFNGGIDDVKMWARVLSDSEIQALNQGGVPSTELLVQNLPLDEGSGTQTADIGFFPAQTTISGAQWIQRQSRAVFQNPSWSTGANTQTLTVNQPGNYSFTGMGSCGIPALSNQIAVSVDYPQANLDAPFYYYCGSEPVQIQASGAVTYTWSPADGLSAASGATVYASPAQTTFYTLTATNASGCQITRTFPVFVQQAVPLTLSVPFTHIMQGQGVPLSVSGGSGNYTWSPATGLNQTSGNQVFALPTQTTTYTVTGIGCEVPQSVTITVLPSPSNTDNALDFDGIDDYVQMPVQTQGIGGTFTVAVWVKPSHPTKTMHIFSTRNGQSAQTFDIQIKDGNLIHGDIGNGNAWLTTNADAPFPYQVNQWMHIAYKITPGEYKIFVNGNLVQAGPLPGTAVLYDNSSNFITLGKSEGEDTFFEGTMDDLMISTFDFPDDIMSSAPQYGLPSQIRYTFDEGIAGGSNPTVTLLTNQDFQSAIHGTLHNFALNGATSNWVEGQSTQEQAITFNALPDVVYGSAPFALNATASSGLAVAYTSSDPSVATVSGNVVTVAGVGTTTIFANQIGNAFYNPAPGTAQTLTVTPKALTISSAVAQNKVYDRNANATIAGTLSGIVNSDDVMFSGTGTFASINVGNAIPVTSTAVLSGAQSGNYTLTQPANLSADITPKALTVNNAVANNKGYDGTTAATISGATLSGIISPDSVSIASNAGIFASANVGNNIAVTSQLTLGGASANNYSLAQPTGLTANITAQTVTATLSGTTSICLGQSAALSVAITGIPGAYTVQYTDGTLIYTAGNYSSGQPIPVSPANTSTYTLISVANANATVSPGGSATVTVTPQAVFYQDFDGDGYGNAAITATTCSGAPTGYVSNNTDCNDNDATTHTTYTFYVDADRDGYGIGNLISVCAVNATTPPMGYSINNTDCNDSDATVHTTFAFYADADHDGYGAGNLVSVCAANATMPPIGYAIENTDCNDAVAAINPGHAEIPYNGIDDNCNGTIDEGSQIFSQVLPSQCGTTLASISSLIGAVNYVNPVDGYRFKVINTSTNSVQVIDRVQPNFAFSMLASYDYATTYSISVMVRRNGIWLNYYGPSCLVSSPAILAQGGAASVSPSQCGTVLPSLSTLIATTSLPGVTGYRFRITNLTDATGNDVVQTLDRVQNWFALTMLNRFNYGTTYQVEVAVKTNGNWSGFGSPCNVSSPAVPTLANCGATISASGTKISTTSLDRVMAYRFEITNTTSFAQITVDRSTNWFAFNDVPGFVAGGAYAVRVAVQTSGYWSPFGETCLITAPGALRSAVKDDKPETQIAVFNATAYPNPYSDSFALDLETPGEESVKVKVYDMVGKLIDEREFAKESASVQHFGQSYPSGVYNIVLTQSDFVKTLRVIKR